MHKWPSCVDISSLKRTTCHLSAMDSRQKTLCKMGRGVEGPAGGGDGGWRGRLRQAGRREMVGADVESASVKTRTLTHTFLYSQGESGKRFSTVVGRFVGT